MYSTQKIVHIIISSVLFMMLGSVCYCLLKTSASITWERYSSIPHIVHGITTLKPKCRCSVAVTMM